MLAVLSLSAEVALKSCPGPSQGSLSVSTLDSGLLRTFNYGLCILSSSNQCLAQSRHLVVLLSVRSGYSSRHSFQNSDCCLLYTTHICMTASDLSTASQ